MRTALLILANQNFQDQEYQDTRTALEAAGIQSQVAAGEPGTCIGKSGLQVTPNLSLNEVALDNYQAIIFIGGPGMEQEYQGDQRVLSLATNCVNANKILGAICIAPKVISDSGVYKDKKITSWDDGNGTQKTYIENNGGIWTGEDVTIDNNIVTANGPNAATAFGTALAKLINI